MKPIDEVNVYYVISTFIALAMCLGAALSIFMGLKLKPTIVVLIWVQMAIQQYSGYVRRELLK